MATSSFFYGGSPAPEQNTVNELIADLEAKVTAAQEASQAAELAYQNALAASLNAQASESSTSALLVQAQAALVAAQEAEAAAEAALAAAEDAIASVASDSAAADAARIAAQAAQALAETAATNAQTSATAAAASQTAAAGSATAAATSATNAASSATSASSSASTATTQANLANTRANAAATSATNAATSATNSASSATAAASSATSAAGSATTATTQATNASNSASAASTSASNAATSATNASTSASNAASSATAAASSATAAAGSATSASGSASTATTQATNAANSATAAAGSATSASGSATTATTQAGIATTQASNAASSATNAAASATSAANSFDSFDDRYLGPKSSAPTLDNDGNALLNGALYFDSTLAAMRVYNTATSTWATIQQGVTNTDPVRHSVRPSLLLDFANTKTLDPRITFTRASTATFYDGKTVAKAEENLFQQSQTFGEAYWTKNNVTITDNSTTAPDGTTTADLMFPTTTGTFRQLRRSDATGQTVSVFAKASGLNFLNIGFSSTSANYTWFDLSGGAVGTTSAFVSSATITDAGNGWYRCTVVFAAAQTDLRIGVADSNGNTTATTSGTNGVFIWGAQLEQRSSVTAYTATTTAPITNYIPALQTAAAGVARFEHNPVTGESLGLEIEEQRTNLLTYSEQFDNASWLKTRSSITPNTIVAPDGTLTGDKWVETTDAGGHNISQGTIAVTSGTAYTQSIYAKFAGRLLTLYFPSTQFGSTNNSNAAVFDLQNGTISSQGSTLTSATIVSVGNGWYRCSITKTATVTANTSMVPYITDGSSPLASYTGDGYSGIYIWGAQLEAGAFATSYIPTVASQVTRSADAASMTGTNFSSWFSNAEGNIYSEWNTLATTSRTLYSVEVVGSATNRLDVNIPTNNIIQVRALINNSAVVSMNNGSYTLGQSFKTSFSYKVGDYASSTNSGTVVTNSFASALPSFGSLFIGAISTGATNLNGTIKKLAYYPKRLTNEELQGVTTV
jgi:hypothetical protein